MSTALGAFPGDHLNEAVVLGAYLSYGLRPVEGPRWGGGLEVGYQAQRYDQRNAGSPREGSFSYWAVEGPSTNFGVVARVGAFPEGWSASVNGRYAFTVPSRVGDYGGWWPGVAVAAEAGWGLCTCGPFGIDVRAAVEGPFVLARVGGILDLQGLEVPQLHLGAFTPLVRPRTSAYTDWGPPDAASR